MSLYYSADTGGFYDRSIHKAMPTDVVEITVQERADLLVGEMQSKVITVNESGRPILIDPTENPAVRASQERAWRDAELESVKWLRERHRDEQELSAPTSLSTERYAELLGYMQALRDWPQSVGFPDASKRPGKPDWIVEQANP